MTQAQDHDDAQWLAALAGQNDADADPSTQRQGAALRRALQEQSQRMDRAVPLADDTQYQQLLFRLKREGLSGRRNALGDVIEWGRVKGQRAAQAITSSNHLAWGLAACVLVLAGVALQMGQMQQGSNGADMRHILRGQGTVLIVADPATRAAELIAGIKAAGIEPVLTSDAEGRVQLRFQANEAVLDYLNTQRIEPAAVDGVVTLTLVAPQQKSN
jgi:hypothetical protein